VCPRLTFCWNWEKNWNWVEQILLFLMHVQVLAPLAIGFTVFLVHLATIPITGTGINPARSFASAAILNNPQAWHQHVCISRRLCTYKYICTYYVFMCVRIIIYVCIIISVYVYYTLYLYFHSVCILCFLSQICRSNKFSFLNHNIIFFSFLFFSSFFFFFFLLALLGIN
jgi:hypothetical protein